MSTMEPTSKPRARRPRKDESQTVKVGKPSHSVMISAEQRRSMIAEQAYFRAERRGFEDGDPVADWLESEKEVDALLERDAD
jgi:DUF2934 family protein